MFGRGYGFASGGSGGSFSWTSQNAKNYYNGLVALKGSDIDSVSIWNRTLIQYKSALDNLFHTLESENVYSKIKSGFLFQGWDINESKLDFKKLTNGTVIGNPESNEVKVYFDGVDDGFNTEFQTSEYISADDCGLTFKLIGTNMVSWDALLVNASFNFQVYWNILPPNRVLLYVNTSNYTSVFESEGSSITCNKSNDDISAYANGVFVNGNSSPADTLLTSEDVIVAKNGTDFSEFGLGYLIFHDYLSAGETDILFNALKTYEEALGIYVP